jgi:hypothetical protein
VDILIKALGRDMKLWNFSIALLPAIPPCSKLEGNIVNMQDGPDDRTTVVEVEI